MNFLYVLYCYWFFLRGFTRKFESQKKYSLLWYPYLFKFFPLLCCFLLCLIFLYQSYFFPWLFSSFPVLFSEWSSICSWSLEVCKCWSASVENFLFYFDFKILIAFLLLIFSWFGQCLRFSVLGKCIHVQCTYSSGSLTIFIIVGSEYVSSFVSSLFMIKPSN